MGKYPKIATVLLAVCMLACLLAGCNELHSDSYEDIMNGIIVDSLYGETYVYNCLGNELSVSIEDGKVFIQSMSEYEPQDDYDAEVAEVYMYSGTYTQENGILTANIDEMRIRYLVSGKDKVAFQTVAIASATREGFKNAAQIFSEKGMLLKDLYYNDPPYPVTATIKIDTTGETWQWISGEVYCEDSTLYECVYMADNGNVLYEHYYGDGYLVNKTEYSPDGIKLRWISYDEDGKEMFHYEYYEDGSLKFSMDDGYVYAAYDRDGNEIEYYSHCYIDGICVSCGEAEPQYSEGLKFERFGESNYVHYGYCVTGLGSCTDADIVIPPMYNGLPVVGIEENAFSQCEDLTSVTIPESVIWVSDSAFAGCINLYEISVHKGHGAETALNSIGRYAFSACNSLTSITIPDSVTSIESEAFAFCINLTSINIGSSVTSIGKRAFYDCSSLSSITVASGNTVYHSAGNCLMETENKNLILGCQNSVIPTDGSVTTINDYAFAHSGNLTSITIPNSVTSIGDCAFSGCSYLTSITIPDRVTSN